MAIDFSGRGFTNDELDRIYNGTEAFANKHHGDLMGKGIRKTLPEMADQIKIYKEQNAIKEQEKVEKRKIQEKQINALRSNFRPGGGLIGRSSNSAPLGDSTGLPNKLGNA